MQPATALRVKVTARSARALDVVSLQLEAGDGRPLPAFEPGAHVSLVLPNGLVRQYSLLNDCAERGRYVIGVGLAPDSRGGSRCVHETLRVGDVLSIEGPRNNFPLARDAAAHVFVAGGIGITPMLSMLRWCEAHGRPWRLVYAVRTRLRAAFADELAAYGGRVRLHCDDEAGGCLDVAGALAGPGAGEHVYCCGPAPLMQAVRAACGERPGGTVHFEWFGADTQAAAQAGAPEQGFWLDLARSGQALFVPEDKSILDVLEAAGHRLPYSCREGLCGTCETRLCAGEAEHRDYVREPAEHDEAGSIIPCVSRARSARLTLDL